jgi:flagellar biosynthesis/type III secretory pathway protein FliH
VRAHPERAAGLRELLGGHGISVVEDGALAPVDAVVETDTTVVDLGVDAALARVAQVLS